MSYSLFQCVIYKNKLCILEIVDLWTSVTLFFRKHPVYLFKCKMLCTCNTVYQTTIYTIMTHRACSQRNESRSESRYGSWSTSWLGSWFELRAFTSIANTVPITIGICALRGNILLLLRSPCWSLTHAWLQRAFPKCTCTNHVPKELCVELHMSSESGFLCESRSNNPFFRVSKAWLTKGQIRLSSQERVRCTFRNSFRNVIHSFVNRARLLPWQFVEISTREKLKEIYSDQYCNIALFWK